MQKKKPKRKITEKIRKKYGVCEHNKVSYKAMVKLADLALKRSKEDAKTIKYLAHRLKQDNWFAEGSPGYGKVLINDIRLKNERIKKLTEERNELAKHVVARAHRRDH